MRYSARPLPPYAHMPGTTPHPRRDVSGHSHGITEPASGSWDPEAWRGNELWLHAADLFNRGYWWECHEALEALWRAAPRGAVERRFVQGLVLVAAAYLNRARGKPAADRQAQRGLERMDAAAPAFMGLDVGAFARVVRADLASGGMEARVRLEAAA